MIFSFVIFSLKKINPANTERIKGKASDIGDRITRGKYLINKELIIKTAKNKPYETITRTFKYSQIKDLYLILLDFFSKT